ncbi:VTT domain-containing protein [Blastococcus sp. TF02A_35]|uniref:TVP38/TMEM64 family protein n=1 Tax=Blastococcus sp. TF02A-35 TaxID=2559612 RepID=UPI0014305F7C|nr:VTT domain-containing protein [Blastococcus sp. TF02A_35]
MRDGGGIWLRAAALCLLVVAGTVAALVGDLPEPAAVRAWLDGGGAAAWALLVGGVAVVLLAPVPRSVVSVLGGLVLGFGAGFAVAVAGGLLAAVMAFWLSRALGRPAVERLAGPRLHRADELLSERTFVSVLAGRVIPVMPFVVISYGAGLSGARFAPYIAATAVGLLPSTVVQVGIGASTGFVVDHLTALTVVPAAAVALVLAVAAGWWLRRRSRRVGEGSLPG